MEFKLHHLAGGRVPVAAQIAQQPACQAALARTETVADPRSPLDVLVGAHVVDQRDKTMVQHREVKSQNLLGARADGSLCVVLQIGVRHGRSFLAHAHHEGKPPASTKAPMRRYFW